MAACSMLSDLRALCEGESIDGVVLRRLLAAEFDAQEWMQCKEAAAGDEAKQNRLRLLVQHGTLKAFVDGRFTARGTGAVAIQRDVQDRAAMGSQFITQIKPSIPLARRYRAPIVVIDKENDCLSVAGNEATLRGRMCCVNFADPKAPGGRYRQGAPGNEEDLHRRTNLFSCLGDPQKKYTAHRAYKYPLGPAHAVFSPKVLVVRGREDAGFPFLPHPFAVNVLTTPLDTNAAGLSSPRRAVEDCVRMQLKTILHSCAQQESTWILMPMVPGLARHIRGVLSDDETKQLIYKLTFCRPPDSWGVSADDAAAEYSSQLCNASPTPTPTAAAVAAATSIFTSRTNSPAAAPPVETQVLARKRRAADDAAAAAAAPEAKQARVAEGGGGGAGTLSAGLRNSEAARLGIRKKFVAALGKDAGTYDEAQVVRRAVEAEQAMHRHFSGDISSAGYRGQLRTLCMNLADPKNNGLRADIVLGRLPCEQLPKMSAADLCNPEKRAEASKVMEEIMADMHAPTAPMQETTMYRCGRCRGRRCSYFELQIRSGDEPMTQFVTCLQCNNKWRM